MVSCQDKEFSGRNATIRLLVTTADTKGTVTTNSILEASGAFSMESYVEDDYKDNTNTYEGGKQISCGTGGNVHLSSGEWIIEGTPRCVANTNTHFWAWHPVTVAGRSTPTPSLKADPDDDDPEYPYTGELTFSYTVPTPDGESDADNAKDIIFAYSKKRFAGSDSLVNITFHHALAQVRFCASTNDGTFDKSLKIKSISISNLKTSGNASFTDSGNAEHNEQFVWSGLSGSATFGQIYDADLSASTVSGWTKGSYTSGSDSYNLYTCENVFFMIPQTVVKGATDATSNMMTVVFDYKGDETVKSVPIAGTDGVEWLGDHYYTYKIKATTVGRDIDMSVSLVGWSNRKEEIFI